VSTQISEFNPDDHRSTVERSDDWKRGKDTQQSKPNRVMPERGMFYYLSWIIALALLVLVVTGTGSILLVKSQKMVQRYTERIRYGVDDQDEKPVIVIRKSSKLFKIISIQDTNHPVTIGRAEVDEECQVTLKLAARAYRVQLIKAVARVNQMPEILTETTTNRTVQPSILVNRSSPEFLAEMQKYIERRYDFRLVQVSTNK
jgi:hypothetical protein